MATPDRSTKPQDHVINEEADRRLIAIMRLYGIPCFLLLLGSMFLIMFLFPMYPHKQRLWSYLSFATLLILLQLFYTMIYKIFQERLNLGRQFVEQQRWREAIASLDPFNQFVQRWLDRTGEAHYLLVRAYTGVGNKLKAEKARKFVLAKRPGEWADKLQPGTTPRASELNRKEIATAQEKRPRPVKSKARRRF